MDFSPNGPSRSKDENALNLIQDVLLGLRGQIHSIHEWNFRGVVEDGCRG